MNVRARLSFTDCEVHESSIVGNHSLCWRGDHRTRELPFIQAASELLNPGPVQFDVDQREGERGGVFLCPDKLHVMQSLCYRGEILDPRYTFHWKTQQN